MHASFTGGRGYYGSPRVHDDLRAGHEQVSRKRLIRLMQEDGLKARVRKRYKGTTMSVAIASTASIYVLVALVLTGAAILVPRRPAGSLAD